MDLPGDLSLTPMMEGLLAYAREQAKAAGHELEDAVEGVAAYAAARAAHLGTFVGKPGWAQAVKAERDAVALRAGIIAVEQADASDQRIRGMLEGALAAAAAMVNAAL